MLDFSTDAEMAFLLSQIPGWKSEMTTTLSRFDFQSEGHPPKILFAIVTCHRRAYAPEATHSTHQSGENTNVEWMRKGWVSAASGRVDVRFFYGDTGGLERMGEDEIALDCGDDYYSLVPKVRAVIGWAYEAGYDYLLKLDDDVYVDVGKALADFLPVDYRGNMRNGQVKRFGEEPELTVKYACGPAYWLSRKAMEAILNSPEPATPYEDRATGYMLSQAGIQLTESTELMTCLCKDCLASPGNYSMFHVEQDHWKEKFLAKYGK